MEENDEDFEERILAEEESQEITQEMLEMMELIEQDPDFEKEFMAFLDEISKDNFDLSALQTKILLLIKPIVEKAYLGKDKNKKMEEIRKEREKLRTKIKDLSFYFTMKKSAGHINAPSSLVSPADKKAFLNDKSTKVLKAELKRHAIYEIYKMANPRRIAGETNRDNFVGNYITKGEKQARKFDGGSDKEIQKYRKDGTMKKVGKVRKKALSKGGLI